MVVAGAHWPNGRSRCAAILLDDCVDAGSRLAKHLESLRSQDIAVLGLPRGRVRVAFEVAKALRASLDVLVLRKLGCHFSRNWPLASSTGPLSSGPHNFLNCGERKWVSVMDPRYQARRAQLRDEARLRRMAVHQNLRLEKSRARHPESPTRGTYQLVEGPPSGGANKRNRVLVAGDANTGYGLTLEEVHSFLVERGKNAD